MKKHFLLLWLPLILLGCNSFCNNETSKISQNASTQSSATNATDATKLQAAKEETPTRGNPSTDDLNALLTTYHWLLTAAHNAQGQRIDELFARPDKPIQFDFDGERVQIGNACNAMSGNYTIQDRQITFGALVSTKKLCIDGKINRLDQAVGERLASSLSWIISPTPIALTLITASGDTLTFSGQPTAETRFGNEGEIVFLEIAPETKPCDHPLVANKQCLQVRKVQYGADGAKPYPPEGWENLYQEIEGYQHEKGFRKIVRVKRFSLANPPADRPNTIYILDTVIETTAVE
ncbi:MAG: META and DUF4377 domain-containing protein [Burkholderiales bacterium]|nr:META and DUF4377 domain-containing protein [Burkholderiales bacterium]